MENQIPKSWCLVPIIDLLDNNSNGKPFQQGWSPQCKNHPATNGSWGVLKTTAIQDGEFWGHENKELPVNIVPRPHLEVVSGDILMTCAGPRNRCGVACFVKETPPKLLMSGKMYRFRPNNKLLDSKFLEAYIRSHEAQLAIDAMKTGISDSGLNLTHSRFAELRVPLAPLNEQKRIVAKIEELFSELDNGIAALKTAREQLKVYRQAVLKHAFEGKLTAQWRKNNADKLESPEQLLARIQTERETRYQQQLDEWKQTVKHWQTNGQQGKKPVKPKKYKPNPLENELEIPSVIPDNWKWISFSELLFSIRGGTTIPPIDTQTYLPILRSSSIRAGRLNLEDIRYLSEDSKISEDDYLNFSDLLFSRLNGTLEFVGVCASVPSVFPKNLIYPDRLYCAKLIDKDMAKFCEYYFSNPVIRRNIEKKAKSTAGHKRISIPDISEQPIPILGKSEITELVKLLSEKLSFADKLQDDIENSLIASETLRQSILKKAFSGQLVPQDPNDEPASELLQHIRKKRGIK
jgi:type I restriction enzyme S subunit